MSEGRPRHFERSRGRVLRYVDWYRLRIYMWTLTEMYNGGSI